MADDRKSSQGGREQSGGKQAPGRRESDEATGRRQGNKSNPGQGSQKGGKQGNR